MRLLPVLDIRHGRVVHARAGRRDEYLPLRSRWTDETTPRGVAEALGNLLSTRSLYLADLDAILDERPSEEGVASLVDAGFELTADLGIRSEGQAVKAMESGIRRVVVGLESCSSPVRLRTIVSAIGAESTVFSLDLLNGSSLSGVSGASGWPDSPLAIARAAWQAGARSMIVLDLAAVGVERGVMTSELCRAIRRDPLTSSFDLMTGGGIRTCADLAQLQDVPVDGVLIASALHGPEFDSLGLQNRIPVNSCSISPPLDRTVSP